METEKGKWREELLCPKNGLDLGSKQAGKQASLGFRFFPRSSDYVLYVCR